VETPQARGAAVSMQALVEFQDFTLEIGVMTKCTGRRFETQWRWKVRLKEGVLEINRLHN
jgi:hypothetical protein